MLNQFNVQYNCVEHTYTLPSGKVLSGITGVIGKYITPNKYGGVPQRIIESAKERGNLVHADISLWINTWREEMTPETKAFANWAEGKNLHSECLVSDGENFASSIDVVEILEDKHLRLYDVKTTYNVDNDYCTWQLSIYAYFAKLAGYNVESVSVLHIKGGQLAEVPMIIIDEQHVRDLLQAAAEDKPWRNPFIGNSLDAAQANEICLLAQAIKQLDERRKYYESKLVALRVGLLDFMKANELTKIDTERVTITIKKPSTRETLDVNAIKVEHPELAAKYTRTEVKESLLIKIKENESVNR